MSDLHQMVSVDVPKHLPPAPDAALMLATIFQRLGGSFHIEQTGRRSIATPCAGAFNGKDGGWDIYPHPVPNAEPTERFLSGDQYEGAIRMLVALIDRLHPSDRTFVFDAFGSAVTKVDYDAAIAASKAVKGGMT